MTEGLLLLPPNTRDQIYGERHISEIESLINLHDCSDGVGDLEAIRPQLADAEVILSGWGMMELNEDFLSAAPNLEAVFYGSGSVRGFVTDAFWERDILLTSAWTANAVPVAESTVAFMVMGLKNAFESRRLMREQEDSVKAQPMRGIYGARIGIIGVGQIGSKVLELLQSYDVDLFCYDPYLTDARAKELNVTPIELDEMFRTCDVVSLHAPNIPSTQNMLTGEHFASMKEGSVFINTARGALIKEEEMVEELQKERILAFLDVTDPEPPEKGSPLYRLDNVFLTPHLAGSMGEECKRMGEYAVNELKRYLAGDPPAHPVTEDMMEWMA